MADVQRDYLKAGGALPQFYGEDRLVILPRDPRNIFAYWEMGPGTRKALEKAGGGQTSEPTVVLRIYKYTRADENRVQDYMDMGVERESNDCYIPVTETDCFYHAELGWKQPGSPFHSIIRSNRVRTPRDSISDIIDENWKLPDWRSQKLFRRISLYHLSSEEFFRRRKQCTG